MFADEQIASGVKDSPYIGDELCIYFLVGIGLTVIIPFLKSMETITIPIPSDTLPSVSIPSL
jgi:hypothetical protein